MLKSHTSSKEEEISYLRKFAQNNNEGCELLEDTAEYHACWSFCKLSILPSPPQPPDWSLDLLNKNSSTASAEELYYSFYHNEELENN